MYNFQFGNFPCFICGIQSDITDSAYFKYYHAYHDCSHYRHRDKIEI